MSIFISQPNQYRRNRQAGANLAAAPALLTTKFRRTILGVVIREGKSVKAVIPVADALRLANEIADAVEAHDHRPNSQPA